MPTYQYQCSGCGEQFERRQRMSDTKKPACPSCGKNRVERVFSSVFAKTSRKS